jgi:hypothetical protein
VNNVTSLVAANFSIMRKKILALYTCKFWASSPKYPPPNPFLTLHTNKKGVNLLRFKQLSACMVLMPNIAIPDEL